MVWGSGALGLMGEARPIGSRYRRNVLVGLLAGLLVVAAVWGSSFRDAADLAAPFGDGHFAGDTEEAEEASEIAWDESLPLYYK